MPLDTPASDSGAPSGSDSDETRLSLDPEVDHMSPSHFFSVATVTFR